MPQIHVSRADRPSGQAISSHVPRQPQMDAHELSALAERWAHAPKDSPDAAKWDKQLGHLVGIHLAAGRDDVLMEALHRAQAGKDRAAFDELGMQVEYESEHQYLGPRPDGKVQEARLFAIPIIAQDVALLGTGHLSANLDTDTLVASLRVNGLIAPTQGMTLVKYLYHPAQLDALSPSSVFRLCRELALAEREEVPFSAIDVPADAEPTGLRYLVGVVTGPASNDSLLLAANEPDEAEAVEWVNKVSHWCARAANLLEGAVSTPLVPRPARPFLEVFPVGGFYEARRLGDVIHKGTTALACTLQVLKTTGIDPSLVHAIVAPYILDDKSVSVVATLTSKLDGSLLGTTAYPVSAFEQLDTALDDVHCMLESRVGEVSVVDKLMPLERCECCGDPMYLTPAQPVEGHWNMTALKASATFH